MSSDSSSDSDDFVDAVDEFLPIELSNDIPKEQRSSCDNSLSSIKEQPSTHQKKVSAGLKKNEAPIKNIMSNGSLDLDQLMKGQATHEQRRGGNQQNDSPEKGDLFLKNDLQTSEKMNLLLTKAVTIATTTQTHTTSEQVKLQQAPDVVTSSIPERPSNLPGILPTTTTASSDSRPKRPPPPKPRHQPPQRPHNSSLDHADDVDVGKLTPNTTVDNITRGFAEQFSVKKSSPSSVKPQRPAPLNVAPVTSTPLAPPAPVLCTMAPPPAAPSITKKMSVSSTTSNKTFDEEILSTVIVRNLDTGQTMPLSAAAEQVSQYLNPLSLQIMSRTKEFNCPTSTNPQGGSNEQATATASGGGVGGMQGASSSSAAFDPHHQHQQHDETISIASDELTIGGELGASDRSQQQRPQRSSANFRQKRKKLQSFISGKARAVKNMSKSQVDRAVQRVKSSKVMSGAIEASSPHHRSNDGSLHVSSDDDDCNFQSSGGAGASSVKFKASSSNKGPYQFSKLKLVQDINVHVGAVWSMKFSHCGRLLATAGQNNIIWVWVLKEYYQFFNDLRSRYENKDRGNAFTTPPRSTMSSMTHNKEGDEGGFEGEDSSKNNDEGATSSSRARLMDDDDDDEVDAPFRSLPFTSYVGHTADVLDLAWSKNYFTLSSSMDKTVRLWHVSQKECLCCFQHIDFVTAIAFHPKDDRYFLSGSLDGKLRLWNIPEKKVALWNEVSHDSGSSTSSDNVCLITSVNFCENGKYAVCGTYDGRCLFFNTEHLKYWTQIHVRSSRRRSQGHKITGVEPLPSEHKVLITSNDSRVRLYDLRDLTLSCKYKGLTNTSSQIKASFSHDCKYIICGSEDKSLYIWPTHMAQDVAKIPSFRRDKNEMWESIRSHDAVVTCAIFAPYPHLVSSSEANQSKQRQVIVSADFDGVIKVFTT